MSANVQIIKILFNFFKLIKQREYKIAIFFTFKYNYHSYIGFLFPLQSTRTNTTNKKGGTHTHTPLQKI